MAFLKYTIHKTYTQYRIEPSNIISNSSLPCGA